MEVTMRLDQVFNATLPALRLLPVAGDPGYPAPGKYAAGLAGIYIKNLGPNERLFLATVAMLALDRDVAEELAETTLGDVRVGRPVPPFTMLREEARNWAALASPGEQRAYMAACWTHLPEAERKSFLSAARPKRRMAA
jgi:hypothetical protein